MLRLFVTVAALQSSLNAILDGVIHANVRDPSPRPPRQSPPASCPDIADLCSSLAGKQILLIGPQTTSFLHSLWLHAHENRYITCHGPASCNAHHVCRNSRPSTIRYIRSDTLHASTNPNDPAYTLPAIDPDTAVRTNNAFWRRHATHADLIVINHGPLPAPAATYAGIRGNWSFADALYNDPATAYLDAHPPSRALTIVNAALHATLTKFLPATLRALDALQNNPSSRLLVWHASWYLQPRCLAAAQSEHAFTVPDLLNPPRKIDPWSLYYNAQVYMQNRLMDALMPQYRGVFHPLDAIPEQGQSEQDGRRAGGRRYASDCLLFPPTTPYGRAMQCVFLAGLESAAKAVFNRDSMDVQ